MLGQDIGDAMLGGGVCYFEGSYKGFLRCQNRPRRSHRVASLFAMAMDGYV